MHFHKLFSWDELSFTIKDVDIHINVLILQFLENKHNYIESDQLIFFFIIFLSIINLFFFN